MSENFYHVKKQHDARKERQRNDMELAGEPLFSPRMFKRSKVIDYDVGVFVDDRAISETACLMPALSFRLWKILVVWALWPSVWRAFSAWRVRRSR